MVKHIASYIVLSAVILAITSLWNDSFSVDEIPHVGAGYSYVTKGDFRLNPEHPPLVKDVAGLTISLLAVNQGAFSTPYWTSDINGQWNFGRTLIYNPSNNVDVITRTAKITMLIFFVLSAALIYRWASERYGKVAALIAITFFSFSPTVIAHSRFVTTDTPALFGILLGTYFFIKFLQKPTRGRFWLATIAFGIAQLTKFSTVLLIPFFILIVIIWAMVNSFDFKTSTRLLARSLMLMALGIILVVWPIYALHTMNYPPTRQKADTTYHLGSYGNRIFADPVVWASDKPVIRSLAQYATGILMVNQRSIGGNTTFFLGEVRNYAWKHYFPVVYVIKEPLAFWLLLIVSLLFIGAKMNFKSPVDNRLAMSVIHSSRKWIKNYFIEFSMLLWIAIYWYVSIRANLNIGVRHLLPTYGFVFMLLAGQLSALLSKFQITLPSSVLRRRLRGTKQDFGEQANDKLPTNSKLQIKKFGIWFLVLGSFGWYVAENIRVFPYYLTYFNQLAGGSAGGYRYVVDSNLDWGQDLKRLASWVEKNNIEQIHLDYFGWADQNYYLKDKFIWLQAGKYKNIREFLAENPNGGYIAVSASFYMGSRETPETSYAWLDSYKPVATIGNSIFVWQITP